MMNEDERVILKRLESSSKFQKIQRPPAGREGINLCVLSDRQTDRVKQLIMRAFF